MQYVPAPTIAAFMRSNAEIKCIVGPVGSGKSMGCIMELFRRMCEQAPDAAGIRPTRFAIVRNTLPQLRDTTLNDIQQYFAPYFDPQLEAVVYKSFANTLEWRMTLPDGTRVHSDWMLTPLERPEDARKLLSLNLTGAWIEEFREVDYSLLGPLRGRCGRYPSPARVRPTWEAVIMSTNPWSEGSEHHEHFVIKRPETWELFRQPGGLTPEAENVEHLPKGYYERLMYGASEEFIKVHVHGMWGDDLHGQAVFRSCYNDDWHVADDEILVNPFRPILVGMDFGRTPAAIITQESVEGRIFVFEELTSDDMGLAQFLEAKVLPALRDRYGQCRIFVVGDPAGTAKSQLSELDAYKVLQDYGLMAVPAPTNDPGTRLRAVERVLLRSVGGKAGFVMSRHTCPLLREGFMRGYRYKKKRDGALQPLPEKNEFSHPHDALQYAMLGHQSAVVGRRIEQKIGLVPVRRQPRFSPRAWT